MRWRQCRRWIQCRRLRGGCALRRGRVGNLSSPILDGRPYPRRRVALALRHKKLGLTDSVAQGRTHGVARQAPVDERGGQQAARTAYAQGGGVRDVPETGERVGSHDAGEAREARDDPDACWL